VARLVRALSLSLVLVTALLAAPAAAAPAAPAFRVPLIDGPGAFDSRALLGKKVLVLRFQASWCRLCVKQAPDMQKIHETYRDRGVEVIGLQVQDTVADARRFREAHGATYPGGLDARLAIANRFGFKGTPYTVVIDRKGEIVARIHGSADAVRLARLLGPLVDRPAGPRPPARLQ
jgi:cytochrome c biogenesis protein CcmG/thiol:disulfide interchange protein DsbE